MTKTEVHIERIPSSDAPGMTLYEIGIDLAGEFDNREKVILFNSARKCDVGKILAGKIDFQYHLIEHNKK